MELLYFLDGAPPPLDLAPPLLGASYYGEAGDVLGMLESIALVAYLLSSVPTTALLAPGEARALSLIEAFQQAELEAMHAALASSELVFAASIHDMAGVDACCRAAEFRQRIELVELLSSLPASRDWVLRSEWDQIRQSRSSVFQAAAIIVGWMQQRFALHYLTRRPDERVLSSPAASERIWPYTLRLFGNSGPPHLPRSRLAGWCADSVDRCATGATLLCVPSLRSPQTMVEALAAAKRSLSGPFYAKPPLARGVSITELHFEAV